MGYYPVMLDVSKKSVALVGSGPMALQKLQGLLAANASVEVFDTILDAAMAPYMGGPARYTPRLPVADDLKSRILVIAAHRDPDINARVKALADEVGALINVVDVPELSNALMVSQLRRGDLVIGVSTSGRGPGVSRRIRQALEPLFDEGWVERLAAFGEVRADIRRRLSGAARQQAMTRLEDQVMEAWRAASKKGERP